MTIAEKINAWLTPDIRKYIHAAVALIDPPPSRPGQASELAPSARWRA